MTDPWVFFCTGKPCEKRTLAFFSGFHDLRSAIAMQMEMEIVSFSSIGSASRRFPA